MVKLGVAEELTVSARVVVAVRLPKAAVTPLGRPDAARVTLPVNPPTSVTVMVLVPLLPCVTDRLPGESESVKLGVADPANRLIIPLVFGLPHPVHRS